MAVSLTGQICTYLKATGAVTSLVPAGQIWSEQAPEGTGLPRIIVEEVAEKVGNLMTTKRLHSATINFKCYDYGKEEARDIALAVSNALRTYTATFDTNNVILGGIQTDIRTVIDRNRPANVKPVARASFQYTFLIEVG